MRHPRILALDLRAEVATPQSGFLTDRTPTPEPAELATLAIEPRGNRR